MNTDNMSAIAVGIGVVALIVGFGIYFNSPDLNKAASGRQDNFVPATVVDNGTTTNVKIDKSQFKLAPELAKISGYINIDNVTIAGLKGRVVLVDFWTYSCINCIRTIPYLNSWYDKYAKDGLVIVGVHSPEFDFEKDYNNVKAATEKFEIKYPVVQDNDKGTWNAYENRYWPHKYLVDIDGYIRYDHIGEGNYGATEQVIQSLLAERAGRMGMNVTIDQSISNPANAQSVNFGQIATPEIYLGYQFARAPLGNPEGFKPDQIIKYSIPENAVILPNTVYLDGEWKNTADHMELQSDEGRVVLSYSAKAANIVAGGSALLHVSEDSSNLTSSSRGAEVSQDGNATVDQLKLYNLTMHQDYGKHQIVIDVKGKGFQIFTFTFG